MSSETDHPRQRTVAELLAEHGDAGATGRRRRRREPDEPDEGAPPPAPVAVPTAERRAPLLPDRSVLREPVPHSPVPHSPVPQSPVPQSPVSQSPAPHSPVAPQPAVQQKPLPAAAPTPPPAPSRPVADEAPVFPARRATEPEYPTDVMPRFRDAAPDVDEGLTGPLPHQNGAAPVDDDAAGPSTMIGAAPVGAEAWHEARTADARNGGAAIDGGPSLPRGPVDADDRPAGLGPHPRVDLEKHDDDALEAPKPRERRLGRAAQESTGPAWATVMMQWIGGALGGAVLWVLFRFLWRNLPVVALASAVLVTVGLVVIVRALLHNNDRRTTIFAVLVGLLLTVSPAILVLLGR